VRTLGRRRCTAVARPSFAIAASISMQQGEPRNSAADRPNRVFPGQMGLPPFGTVWNPCWHPNLSSLPNRQGLGCQRPHWGSDQIQIADLPAACSRQRWVARPCDIPMMAGSTPAIGNRRRFFCQHRQAQGGLGLVCGSSAINGCRPPIRQAWRHCPAVTLPSFLNAPRNRPSDSAVCPRARLFRPC